MTDRSNERPADEAATTSQEGWDRYRREADADEEPDPEAGASGFPDIDVIADHLASAADTVAHPDSKDEDDVRYE